MIPPNILTYIKIGSYAACLVIGIYLGYSFESARFDRYKSEQIIQSQKQSQEQQDRTDQIRKQKDAEINRINNQLVDAVSELRKRPSRSQDTTNGQSGTGAGLYAQDAEFLIREAARADKIRSGLEACYNQYDSIK